MPTGRQRPGFGLAVSDNATGQQIRIVEDRPVRVRDGVPQFSAFVDRARSLRGGVAWDSSGERELLKEFPHSVFVLLNVGIELSVGALEIGIGDDSRSAMAWSSDVDHVQTVFLNDPVEMNVDEIEPRRCAPMAQETRFHMLNCQRLTKSRILQGVDLADGKIIGRAPVGIHLPCVIWGKRLIRRWQLRGIRGS